MSEAELLRELDEKLRGLSVEGLWSPASDADMATYSKDPHTSVLPHVWKWPALYEAIRTVVPLITCTTNGKTLTRSSKVSVMVREALLMAWRWNTSTRQEAIRCRRYRAAFKCYVRGK